MDLTVNSKDFLYKEFLTDSTVYEQAEAYWKEHIEALLHDMNIKPQKWLNGYYGNGWKITDGNPIYNCRIEGEKVIRLIQEEPESDTLQIAAWMDYREDGEGTKLEELVIALELTPKTKKLALLLIKKWVSEKISFVEMDQFIEATLYPV